MKTSTKQKVDTSRTKYLKLDPEYQREVVWDETRSSGLIASIFRKLAYQIVNLRLLV
jgi:hypothetical protein